MDWLSHIFVNKTAGVEKLIPPPPPPLPLSFSYTFWTVVAEQMDVKTWFTLLFTIMFTLILFYALFDKVMKMIRFFSYWGFFLYGVVAFLRTPIVRNVLLVLIDIFL